MQIQTKDKVGAGVIGVGTYGEWHARVYSEFYGSDFIAIADINEERAKKIAASIKLNIIIRIIVLYWTGQT